MFRGKMGRINIISRIRWKQLSSNLASQFVQPLTLDTYEDSKDVLVETPNEVYALADYAVMSNSFAVNNPNWVIPKVNNDGTQGSNNAGLFQFTFRLGQLFYEDGTLSSNYPIGTILGNILINTSPGNDMYIALDNGYKPLLAFGDVFYINDGGDLQYIRANTGNKSTIPSTGNPTKNYLCSAPGTPLALVVGKPWNYNENDPSTWFFSPVDDFGSWDNIPIVGEIRPFVQAFISGNPISYPSIDPNINLTIPYYPNNSDTFENQSIEIIFLYIRNNSIKTIPYGFYTNSALIPLCGSREHVLTFKTQDHYEFSFPPKMIQPYANINFNAEIDDTFMRFIKYTGNPDVVKSVPINMGYQVSYIGRATQRITCVSALTTAFDNYQLNLGAIAIYSPSNSSITL
jgi:hypothetical protein